MAFQFKNIAIPALLLCLTALSGCRYIVGDEGYLVGENGLIQNRSNSYVDASISPAMTIPDNLDSYTIDQLYVIPQLANIDDIFVDGVPLPRPIERRKQEGVIIQALGGRRWIVIDATPSQVWPLVRDYWTQLQVILDYENPVQGVMETAWLEVDNDADSRNKYRLSIEPGLHSGYSEIYITHMSMSRSEDIPLVLNWPEASDSPDRERQIMDTVSQYLADRNDIYQASSSSLLAGSIAAERKANLIQAGNGDQLLELKIDFNRAWVQVRQALNEAGVTIVSEDRDQAIINVSFAGIQETADEQGFIGRLFRFGNSQSEEAQALDFILHIQTLADVINVLAETEDTSAGAGALKNELLRVINENLT